MSQARQSCLWLFMHDAACALFLAALKAGSRIDAKMPMMAITTSNSINVNPARRIFMTLIGTL